MSLRCVYTDLDGTLLGRGGSLFRDADGGFSVSLWDSLDAMQAYEQSAVFKQEIQPTLQPFFVGEYTTYRCDVKYEE